MKNDPDQMKHSAAQNYVIESFLIGRVSPDGLRAALTKLGMTSDFIDAVVASKQKSK